MIRTSNSSFTFLLFIALCVFSSGCDSAPGTADLSASAPIIGNLSVTPDLLDLDALPGSGDVVPVNISIALDASDADGDLKTVFVIVRSPFAGQPTLAEAEINAAGRSRVETSLTVDIPRATVGSFVVTAFASDEAGRMSNRIFGSIEVTSGSQAPTIDQIDIPAQITRPAVGQLAVSVPIVAHVSDPDGADNVAFVEVVVNGAATLRLCDDGGQGVCNQGFSSSGDVASGDSLFTLTIQLDSSNAAGQNTFEFTAIDRTGLRSETLLRVITVN